MSPRPDVSRKGAFLRTIADHPKRPRLLIEGDSWFDLPIYKNLADYLREDFHYATLMLQKSGDTLENMLKEGEYLTPLSEKKAKPWAAFLFSAGGNDILGDPLPSLLNKNPGGAAPAKLVNTAALDAQMKRLEEQFIQLIRSVSRVNDELPILIHGYDYAIPTGRGTKAFWANVAGPWMLPVMKAKNILQPSDQKAVIGILVDRFNVMLKGLHKDFPNVYHIDFRGTLGAKDWGDEIHPTSKAFLPLATQVDQELKKILKIEVKPA